MAGLLSVGSGSVLLSAVAFFVTVVTTCRAFSSDMTNMETAASHPAEVAATVGPRTGTCLLSPTASLKQS